MKELVIPVGLLAIIASILVPLPPGLIDILLVLNLVFALSLLITSLYISEPLKLSSLPTLLLLATLYRLALNISTTRLILGSGNAGDVIEAFGNAITYGNLIVGAVVFLVITLVQFIVIAKGSERVAEVGARFTLDALPGKQMSIDADVRAGLIDFDTAREKRKNLQIESQFYGALDGAMKFVKGDAVAGIVITCINVIGGLAVGIFSQGLDLSAAVSKFTLLTVGDGLVSQIPALLNALSAGLIATRVSRGDGVPLAGELLSQLGQLKQTKIIVGVSSLFLSAAPGLPTLPFFVIGVLLICFGVLPAKTNDKDSQLKKTFSPVPPSLIELHVEPALTRKLISNGGLLKLSSALRNKFFNEVGILLPEMKIEFFTEDKQGIEIVLRGIDRNKLLLNFEAENFEIELQLEIFKVLKEKSVELLDDNLTRNMLDYYETYYSELVANVVPGIVSITQLTEVLKGLIEEGITVKNFDLILQALAESGHKAQSERVMLEDVRVALKRAIIEKYLENHSLQVIALDPGIDLLFSESERKDRPINIDVLSLLVSEVSKFNYQQIPILTSKSSRRLIWECLNLRGLNAIVVAHEEIPKEISLEASGKISLEEIEDEQILEAVA
ncbi:MAG: FHIPEP family type III secretion protein [Bdellovibrionales bacterium]|nr:FHIPEP family type III secretion protein [Bdellovibrionales bacterium]